jgi:tetratricopeptide (TPR) repeat protein
LPFWHDRERAGKMPINMEPLTEKLFGLRTSASLNQPLRLGALLLAVCSIAACVSNPPREADGATATSPVVANPEADAAGTEAEKADAAQQERVQKAIDSLQVGRVAEAKSELAAVLKQDPANKDARSLLAQIQTDPLRYFGGPESFSYTLQQGETLSNVAQRFLDEPLKFYILARFNGVSDPSRLVPGRTIKVPGRRSINAESAGVVEDARVQKARRFYDAGKYQLAIDTLEGGETGYGEARDLLARSYAKLADELLARQDLDGAQALLTRATVANPTNASLRKQLKYVEQRRAIATSYKAGMDAAAAGDIVRALEAFTAVQKLDPANEEVQKQIAAIKDDAVEGMHREALLEYNRQNLDKAIDLWDRVLALLPTHNNARLYRSRAIDLKSKLQKLQ